jgi:hypothetical protein
VSPAGGLCAPREDVLVVLHWHGPARGAARQLRPVVYGRHTQGHVDWLGQQVAARPQDGNLLAVYAAERGHLAKLADQMVSAKLDDQRAVLNETAVEKLELALTGIFRDLGNDPSTGMCGTLWRDTYGRSL